MFARRLLAVFGFVMVAFVLAAPLASATTYSVTTSTYTATNDISTLDFWDAYEFYANAGQTIQYSISAAGGGCVMLLFVKGQSVSPTSQYYASYSQESCAASYSNNFPVASSDGQAFTILVLTVSSTPVTYTINVNKVTPGIPPILLTLLMIILVPIVVVVFVVVLFMRRRRRKASAVALPPPAVAPSGGPPLPPTPPEQPP